MRLRWLMAVLASCVVVFGEIGLAQVTTGTILGTVSDSTGAVIPGANITVRNVETGISRTIAADAAGRYRAPQLGLGSYEITVEATGFQTAVRSGVTLTVGREAVVDFTLQVGAVSERITVTGEAPLVETTNATVASLVDERAMRDLPLNGRSFADLTSIQPGVVSNLEINTPGNTSVYSGGSSATRRSIGGTRPQNSTYLLDGIEISTPSEGIAVNSVLGQQLGVDAIREFTLLQSNYGAQFGRASGGVINAVTQSGTNEFHGSAFEFLRNDVLDARDYFIPSTLPKTPLRRNQFGGSLGGPIQKDRTFFFLNYEAVRQSSGEPRVGSSLTPETRLGNITACPAGKSSCAASERIISSTVKVSSDTAIFFPLLPLPNGPYRAAGVADLYSVPNWQADENYGIARIDQQLSGKDSLFGRITKDQSARTDQLELITPKPFRSFQEGGYTLVAVSETHIFSPSVLNTFRVGFTRRNDRIFYNYTKGGDQFPDAPGLDPRFSPVKGIPLGLYAIAGVSVYSGIGPSLGGPAIFIDNTFDYDDSVNLNRGRHSLILGGNFKRYQMNTLNEPFVYGNYSWQTIERFLTNRPFNTTQIVGSHVPGLQAADAYRGWRQSYGAAYVQDDFKALPNLSLNLGLRWEKVSSPMEVNGKVGALLNLLQDATFTLLGKEKPLFELHDGLKGLSPRFGFAWTPFADQKTVLRGGFGVFKEMPLLYVYQLALDAPPYFKRFQVNDPLLKFPFAFANESQVATAGGPINMPNDVKEPYSLQWTFSIERQLSDTFVLKVNYLGTRGVNLFAIYNPNQPPTTILNGRQYTPADAKTPNPNFTSFRYISPISTQTYHSGQLVIEKRFSQGLRFNGSYTWSRNLDNGGGAGTKCAEQVTGAASFNVENGYDRAADKGLSSLHVAQNFIVSYTYELPFGSGRRWGSGWPGVVDYFFGGWVLNGTNTLRTGLPVTIGGLGRQSRCPAECAERPDLKPGGNINPVLDNWTPERYFDPNNFVLQSPGFFGNVGRNTLIRPGSNTWNFSISKDNRLGEGKNLEFRAEFFNAVNHPNFGGPSAGIFRNAAGDLQPDVGRITTTSSIMRQIQLGLKLTF